VEAVADMQVVLMLVVVAVVLAVSVLLQVYLLLLAQRTQLLWVLVVSVLCLPKMVETVLILCLVLLLQLAVVEAEAIT
jgi:hypothetical protein